MSINLLRKIIQKNFQIKQNNFKIKIQRNSTLNKINIRKITNLTINSNKIIIKNKSKLCYYITSFSLGSFILLTLSLHLYSNYDKQYLNDNELPLQYNPIIIENYWDKHQAIVMCRLSEIVFKSIPFIFSTIKDWLIPFTIKYYTEYNNTNNDNNNNSNNNSNIDFKKELEEKQQLWGAKLRELLVDLGPTFIKFGQMLSIRPDLLPQPILLELQKLCDNVPPISTKEAIQLIEKEFNKPVSEIFDDLDENSNVLAAASLGQVYKCKLKGTNQIVAVKIQRPDMLSAVSLDLYIMRKNMVIVEFIKKYLMKFNLMSQSKQYNVNLFDCFASGSYSELDYINEANNQLKFINIVNNHSLKRVYIPKVFSNYTTRRVITTEFITGIQLAKSSPEIIKELVPYGIEFFIIQLLDSGIFHGDPHPGNLLVNEKKQLVLLDFGLCQNIDKTNSIHIRNAIINLISNNVNELLEDIIELGFLPNDIDRSVISPLLKKLLYNQRLNSLTENSPENNLGNSSTTSSLSSLPQFKFTDIKKYQFQVILDDLNLLFFKYPFVIPEYFALLIRSLIVLEGIAVSTNPNFDIFHEAYPYALKHAMKTFDSSDVTKIALSLARHTKK